MINIDHRKKPLFGEEDEKNGFWFFKGLWSDDVPEAWEKQAKEWGISILVKDDEVAGVKKFSAPREIPNTVFTAAGLGDKQMVRQGITVRQPVVLYVYALGEEPGDGELVDFGWIVNAATRERVWEMTPRNTHEAGGAKKNVQFTGSLRLDAGDYVVYYVTDDSHSADDWNSSAPYDPRHWGITLSVDKEADAERVKRFEYKEVQNVIAAITKVGDDETRQVEFSLKDQLRVRIYAFGERSNTRRLLADYGYLMDARTREKVWAMDIDRCRHAGGASKNLYVDEVITLPKASYVLVYKTDDSHSYQDWNADPPFDEEHYGITLMGVGKSYRGELVEKGASVLDTRVVAQIVRVGNDARTSKKFYLDKPSRLRIYAIGEGQKRTMYDYGWIENMQNGTVVWEMTYGMSFHAGGARKNRMVNTTILLEKGDYALHYSSDDSHSYQDWNEEPPDDPQFWGITLYEAEPESPLAPPVPKP
jgi:hypothetical protein